MKSRLAWLAIVILLAAIGSAFYVLAVRRIDPQELAASLRSVAGEWWMPLAYAAAYAVSNLLFIPTQALSVVAVLLWGWEKGGTIEWVSATVGALPPYFLARRAARDRARNLLRRYPDASQRLEKEGGMLLLVLRLFPVVPYTALNYLAGLSAARPLQYTAITAVGIIPSTFIFAYFVDSLIRGIATPREVAGRIFIAGALLALFVILGRLVTRRLTLESPAPMPLRYPRAFRILRDTFGQHPFKQRLHIYGRFLTAPFLRTLDIIPVGARVLDIGAGHGTYARLVVEERAREVIAVEPDLRKTLIAFRHPRVRFVAGFDDCIRGIFDVVVVYDVIYRLPPPERDALFRRIYDRLRPGGTFVLKDLDPAKRLKWSWNRIQEKISDAVFGLTIGKGFYIDTREEIAERMQRAGFSGFTHRHVDFGYPHAHIIYTATKPVTSARSA